MKKKSQDIHKFLMNKAEEHFLSSVEGDVLNVEEWFDKMSSEVDSVQVKMETDFDNEAVLLYIWACYCDSLGETSDCKKIGDIEIRW